MAKYGERILTTPPARGFNRLVYILPWVITLTGVATVALVLRKWISQKPAVSAGPILEQGDVDRIDRELRDLD